MKLASELDVVLDGYSDYRRSREGLGRVWVAHRSAESPVLLPMVANDLSLRLSDAGFEISAASNEPAHAGKVPCLHVRSLRGERLQGQLETIIIVPCFLLGRLREVRFELQRLDLQSPEYSNVRAYYDLVRQGLFLSRRKAMETQAHVDRVREFLASRKR